MDNLVRTKACEVATCLQLLIEALPENVNLGPLIRRSDKALGGLHGALTSTSKALSTGGEKA